jgi:filamin
LNVSVSGKPLSKSPYKLQVKSGCDKKKTTVTGPGVQDVNITGVPTSFQITSKDSKGKIRSLYNDNFNVVISGVERLTPQIVNNDNGVYDVFYTPKKSGKYMITISLDDEQVLGTYNVNVDNDYGPDDSKSYVQGPFNLVVGNKTKLRLYSKDKNDKPRNFKEEFKLSVEDQKITPTIEYLENGEYSLELTPINVGKLKLTVKTPNGKEIKGSPMNFNVYENLDVDKSSVSNMKSGIPSGEPTKFTITSKSKEGKLRNDVVDDFDIKIIDQNDIQIHYDIEQKSGGVYDVTYTPTSSGKYKISILSGGNLLKGKPFEVDVLNGANPTKTFAIGKGIKTSKVGSISKFQIFANDKNGKPRIYDDNFTFDVNGPSEIKPIFKSNKNGSYDVSYTPDIAGKYVFSILLGEDGEDIIGSPFLLDITEGVDFDKTTIEGIDQNSKTGERSSFKIITRDESGKERSDIVDEIDVDISTDVDGENVKIIPKISQSSDGVYSVDYLPIVPGVYEIKANINGKPLKGHKLNVKSGADPTKCIVDCPIFENKQQLTSGVKYPFTIKSFKNKIRKDFRDSFNVIVDGPSPHEPKVISNNDGEYYFKFDPKLPGKYKIKVKLDNEKEILGSPFLYDIVEGANPESTSIEGLNNKLLTGEIAKFIISTKDKNGKERGIEEDISFEIDSPSIEPKFTISKENDSTLNVEYTPKSTGKMSFEIKCNDNLIPNGKKLINVIPSIDPNKSKLKGLIKNINLRNNDFKITTKDNSGENITSNENLDFEIDGPNKIIPKISLNKDGSINVDVNPFFNLVFTKLTWRLLDKC